MLKKRIIASLTIKEGIVVQSINFKEYLPIGKPEIAVEFLNQWGIDEIIYTDISAQKNRQTPNFKGIKTLSHKCFVPLTVGGGITNTAEVAELMHCGADKVSLNRALFDSPKLITDIAVEYGDQCVVVSIDAIKVRDSYYVYNYLVGQPTSILVEEAVKRAIGLGAGEIIINSVERDGSYTGYDLKLIDLVCNNSQVPVLALGGAKNALDLISVLTSTNASAACAGNFFHFSEHSVILAKRQAHEEKVDLRLDTHTAYEENSIGQDGRLLKKSEYALDKLLYLKIEKEII